VTAAIFEATPEHARNLTDRIKVAVEGTWHLITEAYTSRAWAALGYSSWDDYCTREFGTSRLRLPREDRSEVVQSLRESGLSVRAIAAVTGDHYSTVSRELSGVANATPKHVTPLAEVADEFGVDLDEPGSTNTELDWDDEPALTQEECEALDNQDRAAMLTDAEEADAIEAEVKATRITGTDGKSYPKPEPKAPQRKSLIDVARDMGYDIGRLATRIQKLSDDDRLTRNADQVAVRIRRDLIQMTEACQGLLAKFPSN
jgi:transcriptional regulator with XRE-family HTH domain